jgi:hypothetical protein
MFNINLGASRSKDLGWRDYDQQFRMKKERNPSLSWGDIDMELWVLSISQGRNSNTQSCIHQSPYGKCFDYNNKGKGELSNCRFAHKCIIVDLIQLYIVSLNEKTNLLIVVIVPRVFSVPIAEEIDFAQGGKMDQLGKTPINDNKLEELLEIYPNTVGAHMLLNGFTSGFKVNYEGPRCSYDSYLSK